MIYTDHLSRERYVDRVKETRNPYSTLVMVF